MSTNRDKRIDGEFDRPLPKRIENPTKEDREKLEKILAELDRKRKAL